MYEYQATLVRVVDGDTVHLNVDLGFRTGKTNENFRLARINAPEMNTPEGRMSRAALVELLPIAERALLIRTYKDPDKYGRYLVDIFVMLDVLTCVNDWLVQAGFAVPY